MKDRVKNGMLGGGGLGMGVQFFNLRYTYISNMRVQLGLEPFKKFVVGWVGV